MRRGSEMSADYSAYFAARTWATVASVGMPPSTSRATGMRLGYRDGLRGHVRDPERRRLIPQRTCRLSTHPAFYFMTTGPDWRACPNGKFDKCGERLPKRGYWSCNVRESATAARAWAGQQAFDTAVAEGLRDSRLLSGQTVQDSSARDLNESEISPARRTGKT